MTEMRPVMCPPDASRPPPKYCGVERFSGDSVEAQRDGVRDRREKAQQATDLRAPLRFRRRHLPQESEKRLFQERNRHGRHRCQQ